MLRPALCELLGIEVPVIQAPIVPGASPELVAAVSNAGAIGSLGAAFLSAEELTRDVASGLLTFQKLLEVLKAAFCLAFITTLHVQLVQRLSEKAVGQLIIDLELTRVRPVAGRTL